MEQIIFFGLGVLATLMTAVIVFSVVGTFKMLRKVKELEENAHTIHQGFTDAEKLNVQRTDEIYREMRSENRSHSEAAKAYTDSRFDKLQEKQKVAA